MLKVCIPNICQDEQCYALDILLREFLGLAFEVETYNCDVIEINRPGYEGKVTLDASFFHKAHSAWLKSESMPVLPLANWMPAEDGIEANLVETGVPVLYGQPGLVKVRNYIHLNVDIFGSAFFMLSRYEELITTDRDKHDRFPAWASVAYKANFLERPIVNEYLEILWESLKVIFPSIQRLERKPSIEVSCDVDDPYDCLVNQPLNLLKTAVSDVLKRKDLLLATKRLLNFLTIRFGIDRFDPYNTFDWYMDVCERNGLKATFYFIVDNSSGKIDGCYSIHENKIQLLISNIIGRGHKVGVHGSYNAYQNLNQIEKEATIFKEEVLANRNYKEPTGIRQHYLRIDYSITQDFLENVGYSHDTTGGYADISGFRFGVCYEFSMWSWSLRNKLKLKQQPLIAMEVAVFSKHTSTQALKFFDKLKKICFQYNGCYSLLWHNSQFYSLRSKVFEVLLDEKHD